MSIIDTNHNVVPYTTGVTKPFTGQRLAVVGYKTDKATKVKKDSVCASIPALKDTDLTAEHMTAFIPHIVSLCERTQDLIVRAKHEAGSNTVSDAELSISAVLEYLNAESSGGRLNKAQVTEWFDNEIADNLSLALAQKMGVSEVPTDEESARIETLVSEFRSNIGALTAGNTKYDPDTCRVLMKAVGFAGDNDPMKERMIAKLETMSKRVPKSMVDSL